MRSEFRNDYAYALLIREWRDSKDNVWFAGFALRSNETYKRGDGVASFGEVIETFEPELKPFSGYENWYRGKAILKSNVWIDVTRNSVKRKKELGV